MSKVASRAGQYASLSFVSFYLLYINMFFMLACIFKVISEVLGITLTFWLTQIFSHFFTENVTFPSQYPTGCLLGCVDMVDCLAQEQYREKVSRFSLQCSLCGSQILGKSNLCGHECV